MRILCILGALIALSACDSAPEPELAETSGFFDEAGLLEGAIELDEAACVGEGTLEIRGQVATLTAQATSLLDESVVSETPVELSLSSVDWDVQDALLSTKTDALGRFCFRVPAETTLGPNAVLKAATTPPLRRLVLDARDVNIHLSSEAVIQVLQGADVRPSLPLRARLLNLTTTISTHLELLQPVEFAPATPIDAVMDQVLAQLRSDERIQTGLEVLKTGESL